MAAVITLVNTDTKEEKTLYSADARALLANQQKDGGPQVWKVSVPGLLAKPESPSRGDVQADQARVQRGGPQDPQEALEAEGLETKAAQDGEPGTDPLLE